MNDIPEQTRSAAAAFDAVGTFYMTSRYGQRRGHPDIADFTFGNPHEMPLPGLVDALNNAVPPQDKNWYAYKTSEEAPQAFVAEALGGELGLDFEPADIALTAGAFAAISLAIRLVLSHGDEAIFSEPAWFCYEPMLKLAGAVPRKVQLAQPGFDLDLDAIEAAIGPKTRLVIVNTPHNPTGRIVPRETLEKLAAILDAASARIGHRIYLLSDEPYRRLRFDGNGFVSPLAIYPWSLMDYSYGKVLLAPGQRLGYLAISPLMPEAERRALREIMFPTQMALGWTFPNALMQYAIPDLEDLTIDIDALTRRRDLLSEALATAGCRVLPPEGTFYLWSQWPAGDPEAHFEALADRDVFVLPGSLMSVPDHFRISLTASDAMVERALPAFRGLAST